MCLYISPRHPHLYRATRNILVRKTGSVDSNGKFRPTFRNFHYTLGKMEESILVVKKFINYYSEPRREVYNGLHAYTSRVWSRDAPSRPAIIPRGAYFYIDSSDEIVSTHLIVYDRSKLDTLQKKFPVFSFQTDLSDIVLRVSKHTPIMNQCVGTEEKIRRAKRRS